MISQTTFARLSPFSSHSPYLSDEILEALITRNEPVNQWIVCEVLIANSPLSLDVIDEYNQAPLSDYLDGILMNYQDGVSTVTREKAKIEVELSLEGAIVRDYVARTSFDADESEEDVICSKIKDVYETAEINKRVKSLFPILLKEGRTTEAESLLGEYIPACSDDCYVELAEVILSLDLTNLSTTEFATVEQLASNVSVEGIQALVLLEVLTGVSNNYPVLVLPTVGNKSLESNKIERKLKSLMEVSPNPAQEYFYVSYVAPPQGFENAVLRLTDISGRDVEVRDLKDDIGVSFYNCSQLTPGTYLIVLELNRIVISTEKIIIH